MSQKQELRDTNLIPTWHSRGYLPHFESPERVQHVTVHLADSLPKSAVDRIDQMIDTLPDQERAVERRKRLHEWIDAGHGSCILREPDCAKIVEQSFFHFDSERYRLFAWVVMPNHFHVLFQPIQGWTVKKVVASWKKFTATEIKKWPRANAEIRDPGNATLAPDLSLSKGSCSASGKSPLWHPEYWDRYIRNKKHFDAVIDYIHDNPIKAHLCAAPEVWRFSSVHQS